MYYTVDLESNLDGAVSDDRGGRNAAVGRKQRERIVGLTDVVGLHGGHDWVTALPKGHMG